MITNLVKLAQIFANANGIKISTVSQYASGQGMLFQRLQSGADITHGRSTRILQWFADNWPVDLSWPADIPHPDPAPDSPYMQALLTGAGGQAGPDRTALTRLNEQGHIADVQGFLDALTGGICPILRPTFDQVVAQYADGKPRATAWPRRNSNARKVLDALMAAGDRRFAERAALMRRVFGDAA